VAEGEALGVVGPNGAGKTTLLDIVAGAQRRDRGRVLLGGVEVTGMPTARRCRLGLARTFQVPRPLGDLTVFETALLAAVRGGGKRGKAAERSAIGALGRAGLLDEGDRRSSGLRLLSRKRLELARALAAGPRVLLLDEIAGGLTEHESSELVKLVKRVRERNVTVIWIEHVLNAIMAAADRMIVLNFGEKIAEGAPQDVIVDPNVRRVYMGIEA
jgi:branched-chain amino acid transport system ATP-binding protein